MTLDASLFHIFKVILQTFTLNFINRTVLYRVLSNRKLQVAIWRDSERKRLVVAFRGTEQVRYFHIIINALSCVNSDFGLWSTDFLVSQVRWKDLRTDLMLVPAG